MYNIQSACDVCYELFEPERVDLVRISTLFVAVVSSLLFKNGKQQARLRWTGTFILKYDGV